MWWLWFISGVICGLWLQWVFQTHRENNRNDKLNEEFLSMSQLRQQRKFAVEDDDEDDEDWWKNGRPCPY